MSGSGRDQYSQVAESVPFDNDTNGFTSDDVQGAIEEVGASVSVSVSPGFSWGRSGNLPTNTWLQNETVPSNKSGRIVTFSSPEIVRIYSASEDIDTYTLTIYEHEGDEINLTSLTTLSVVSSRNGDSGIISVSVTSGRQLGVKLTSGSAKNLVVGMILTGENA